ncbi:glycosyltransferase family 4 protein [Halanaerobium congolense]|uniref:glycosyltransferase family 4 protein n=1 Tax=Halanaerobium congolense TaxID=54121 RepID=UPI00117AD8EB|nr:glycosyltransferase family 4 protein [Halanaerobium congolense]
MRNNNTVTLKKWGIIMIILYYKDHLNDRQNKPFIDYFEKNNIEYKTVSNLHDIKIKKNQKTYILVGILDFFEVYLKYFFNKKVDIIYRARGIVPEESFYRNNSYIKFLILSLVEFIVLILSDLVITVSLNQKNHYVKKYKLKTDKIFVLHNYLMNYKTNFNDSSNRKLEIVYVGGLAKWQKIDDLKSIFEKLSIVNEQLEFLICAKQKNILEFKKKFKKIDNIKFESYSDYNALMERISKSTVGIILRDNSKVNKCSSPFKIIDYINAQLPIIMTQNIGDYNEILKNQDFIFELDKTIYTDANIKKIESYILHAYSKKNKLKKNIRNFRVEKLDFAKEFSHILKNINFE